MKKILLLLLALLIIAAIYLKFGKQAKAIPESTISYRMLKAGPYKVRADKLSLLDNKRGIDANGEYPGSPVRELKVFVWTPASNPTNPQPLMIYSHGFMSNGKGGDYLARHLASYGYTVAAATYPLTHYGAPGGPNPADVVNQPSDVSFIIDTLLQENVDSASQYYQLIDPSRIAASGLSLGGLTTELVAFHPLNADQRIAAAISIAGPANMFSKRFFADRSIPFMMIATPQDALVAYAANAADITEKVPGATLVSIDGASHTGFSSTASWLRWMDNPDSLGCKAVLENADVDQPQNWFDSVGGSEVGILPQQKPDMCSINPLPLSMNPLRQHQLNTLAVSSFLQCHFAEDAALAKTHCEYLNKTFAEEIPEVTVSF